MTYSLYVLSDDLFSWKPEPFLTHLWVFTEHKQNGNHPPTGTRTKIFLPCFYVQMKLLIHRSVSQTQNISFNLSLFLPPPILFLLSLLLTQPTPTFTQRLSFLCHLRRPHCKYLHVYCFRKENPANYSFWSPQLLLSPFTTAALQGHQREMAKSTVHRGKN